MSDSDSDCVSDSDSDSDSDCVSDSDSEKATLNHRLVYMKWRSKQRRMLLLTFGQAWNMSEFQNPAARLHSQTVFLFYRRSHVEQNS